MTIPGCEAIRFVKCAALESALELMVTWRRCMAIPGAICAAKKMHDIFQDRSEIPEAEIRKVSSRT